MLNILAAAALGFLSGMGIGGGSLLMLYLTLVLDMPLRDAKGLNLMFFLPCAICASLFRLRKKSLSLKPLWIPILSGVLCAYVFSRISAGFDENLLRKGFGILLLLTALRELRYRPRKAR